MLFNGLNVSFISVKSIMKIGYARISTGEQNNALQLDALKAVGCERIFEDTATGASVQRPQLQKCLKSLQDGDILAVYKLDRLGRSLGDIIGLLDGLKARGVAFQSITEVVDTTTATGRAMWQMLGIMAELERSLIAERTQAGKAAAVARGVKMGRKPLLEAEQIKHISNLLEQGSDIHNIMKLFKVSRSTLYRAIKDIEDKSRTA